MTSYNPAHYRAEGYEDEPGAAIYCTQCPGNTSLVYTVHAREDEDPQFLDRIIDATRQHHDDHHAPPQCTATIEDYAGTRRCDDIPDHYGVHTHLRSWWPNTSYPAEAGPCTTEHCTKYNGHPNDCHIKPQPPQIADVEVPF